MIFSKKNNLINFEHLARNVPEFSVSEFSRSVKNLLEDSFGYVRIKGEIVGSKLASSGHFYFNLKEDNSSLTAICFRNQFIKVDFDIADGLQVVAMGKISTFEGRSNYQIIVESLEISGLGAVLEMLQKRKEKLQAEGLFDNYHKKSLPFLPQIIGIISSESGAVIEDIKHRILNRFPTHLMLYPAQMQGKKAANEIIAGLRYFNRLKKNRPDLLIVARGGGSFEDLLPFNDEKLVREAFQSKIPLISAIGHETDHCLLDLVADLRAPTPTAAAEIATPLLFELRNKITNQAENWRSLVKRGLEEKLLQIAVLQKYLPNPRQILLGYQERVLSRFDHLKLICTANTALKQQKIENLQLDSKIFLQRISFFSKKITDDFAIVERKIDSDLQHKNHILNSLAMVLAANSHHEILRKGFALIKDENGRLISSAKIAKITSNLAIEMNDGIFKARPLDEKSPSLFDSI